MRRITVAQFRAELAAQGVPRDHYAFVCPMCKSVQSAQDLILAGAGKDFAEVEKYLAFSCFGRWTKAGSAFKQKKGQKATPGMGCDYTLGGLFSLAELEIVVGEPTGPNSPQSRHSRFELATPEEAIAHSLWILGGRKATYLDMHPTPPEGR